MNAIDCHCVSFINWLSTPSALQFNTSVFTQRGALQSKYLKIEVVVKAIKNCEGFLHFLNIGEDRTCFTLLHTCCQISQECYNLWETVNKTSVEPCKSEKYQNVSHWFWFRPFLDGLNVRLLHLNASHINHKAQKGHLITIKCAFWQLHIQSVFKQCVKHLVNMLSMFFFWVWINEHVIQIHHTTDVNVWLQCAIYVGLKSSRSVNKVKKHNLILKLPVSSVKSSFPFVTLMNLNVMICVVNINFCETLHTCEALECLWQKREWVLVLNSNLIESSVVHT